MSPRLLCCALAVGLVSVAAYRLPRAPPPPHLARLRHTLPRALVESERESPPELFGPWELRSSYSGAEEGWVELEEGGQIVCSRSMGSAREWYAQQLPGKRWRLHMTLLDKLGRPHVWVGDVRPDEYRGVAVDGTVSRPGRGQGEFVKNADFRGWKLDG